MCGFQLPGLIMSTCLIRSDTSQSSSYPVLQVILLFYIFLEEDQSLMYTNTLYGPEVEKLDTIGGFLLRVQGSPPNTTHERTRTKNIEIHKHPVYTHPGIIPWQISWSQNNDKTHRAKRPDTI